MGSLRLYAIAIDEVRDIFSAPEETAAALRAIAADRFAEPRPAAPGLLGKLGPVFRRAPDAPVARPGVPSGADVDALLAGRYVQPHRLAAAWTLLEAWLEAMSWGTLADEFTESGLNEFDFDLARAGVPSRYGLQDLLKTDLGIAMMPCPGLASGYATLDHALAMGAAWRPAVPDLPAASRPVAQSILAWLDGFAGWAEAAPGRHRPPPDLVAVLRA